jgi:cardiolipin synthase
MDTTPHHESDRIFTLSNCISFFRILLIVPTIVLLNVGSFTAAAAVMLFAYLTDIADGYVARKTGTISEAGKIIDPLADKLYVAALVIMMVTKGLVPLWLVFIILGKDLLTMVGAAAVRKRLDAVPPSNYWGKAAIFSTIIFLFLSVLGVTQDILVFGWVLSAILLIVSFAVYAVRGWRIIRIEN